MGGWLSGGRWREVTPSNGLLVVILVCVVRRIWSIERQLLRDRFHLDFGLVDLAAAQRHQLRHLFHEPGELVHTYLALFAGRRATTMLETAGSSTSRATIWGLPFRTVTTGVRATTGAPAASRPSSSPAFNVPMTGDQPEDPAHLPLRHVPSPQSLSEEHEPSGELAHLPLRQAAFPQSLSEEHEPPEEVAHVPLRQLTPAPQSLFDEHPPEAIAHLPLRQLPRPQSLSEEQSPSGAFAHLPLRHAAPPQSELEEQLDPAAVAHLPLRHETPGPQSELEEQSAINGRNDPSRAAPGVAMSQGSGENARMATAKRKARRWSRMIDLILPCGTRMGAGDGIAASGCGAFRKRTRLLFVTASTQTGEARRCSMRKRAWRCSWTSRFASVLLECLRNPSEPLLKPRARPQTTSPLIGCATRSRRCARVTRVLLRSSGLASLRRWTRSSPSWPASPEVTTRAPPPAARRRAKEGQIPRTVPPQWATMVPPPPSPPRAGATLTPPSSPPRARVLLSSKRIRKRIRSGLRDRKPLVPVHGFEP